MSEDDVRETQAAEEPAASDDADWDAARERFGDGNEPQEQPEESDDAEPAEPQPAAEPAPEKPEPAEPAQPVAAPDPEKQALVDTSDVFSADNRR